ncbi:MAG: hypothetical protein H7Y16_07275 [Candidatus Parcubacteria bacterium]|nr:hypothetical protein [Burkholderiales bacterium]
MIRIAIVALGLAFAAGAAQAQFRVIPAEAKRATLKHVEGMTVELSGKRTQLAAGAQIRDGRNMIVVPTAVPPDVLVKYMPDSQGQVSRIWILSPQEAAAPDPKK